MAWHGTARRGAARRGAARRGMAWHGATLVMFCGTMQHMMICDTVAYYGMTRDVQCVVHVRDIWSMIHMAVSTLFVTTASTEALDGTIVGVTLFLPPVPKVIP